MIALISRSVADRAFCIVCVAVCGISLFFLAFSVMGLPVVVMRDFRNVFTNTAKLQDFQVGIHRYDGCRHGVCMQHQVTSPLVCMTSHGHRQPAGVDYIPFVVCCGLRVSHVVCVADRGVSPIGARGVGVRTVVFYGPPLSRVAIKGCLAFHVVCASVSRRAWCFTIL
jgi:hypothetical protein